MRDGRRLTGEGRWALVGLNEVNQALDQTQNVAKRCSVHTGPHLCGKEPEQPLGGVSQGYPRDTGTASLLKP